MYGYYNYVWLTPEQVLQKITQEQIFEYVLEQPFSFANRYTSPFREDKHPGCRFEQREDGTILFIDFGDIGHTHRSCFGALIDKMSISMVTKVSLDEAVKQLVDHFKLSTDSNDYEPSTNLLISPTRTEPNTPVTITYDKAQFSKSDIRFWSQFLIRELDLFEDRVFATHRFQIVKEGFKKTINVYGHCYAIDFLDAVQIYQPYNEKYKWISSTDIDHIGNFDNLPATGDDLIIASGYKDHRVVRNVLEGSNVIWFKNEGTIPSVYILDNLLIRFKRITVFYDNDLAGRLAARKLVDVLNGIAITQNRISASGWLHTKVRMIYLPQECGYKDPGEYVFREGRQDTLNILKQIGL